MKTGRRLNSGINRAALSLLLLFTLPSLEAADVSGRITVAPQAEPLEFDQVSGFYESPFRLNLSTRIKGATIFYTTNASMPHPSTGLRYGGSIPVSTTTIVRATGFNGNTAATDVITRSYLFAPAILNQTGAQLPQVWGTNSATFLRAHYQMSQHALNDAASRDKIIQGLQAIPTLSIVTDSENLFSTPNGIYLHPTERGDDWERPASIELFGPRAESGFRINCGLRIHGGMSRRPEESPKHSFRLTFKRRYGAAKLDFPVFAGDKSSEFDELVLRAGGSDSWLDSNGERRRRAAYVRDEWMRQSMAAMGHPSARGQFVHLYLNGLYWGVYNLCERPGASLLSAGKNAFGLKYDVRNADKTESGDRIAWDQLMALANAGLSDAVPYEAISQALDLNQFADYLILNFYAGNSDWDRSANWYAIRPRTADGRFQFFVWDAEQTFGDVEANPLGLDENESPMRLFHKLSENAAFRALFAARVQLLLFNDGPLASDAATERFRRLAHSIEPALAAEGARWGSYRAGVHQYKSGPYENLTVQEHWQAELNRIFFDYIPKRREALIQEFRERGLFPVNRSSGDRP